MAEGEGFEPPVRFPAQRFSRPSQSTTLPPLRFSAAFRRSFTLVAGREGLEPPTDGFGDRYSTN
jgi:hypothetical protein